MILVRTGGVLGVVIALMVAALIVFIVRPAINDTTQRAFDTADRMLDDANTQIDAIAGSRPPLPRRVRRRRHARSSRSSAPTRSCSTSPLRSAAAT